MHVDTTPEFLEGQMETYITALVWNLHYYYNGCQSWSWFYPSHYSPYVTDIKDCANVKVNLEMAKPFLPFEQLLSVLPYASANLLPDCFKSLMEESSPIYD